MVERFSLAEDGTITTIPTQRVPSMRELIIHTDEYLRANPETLERALGGFLNLVDPHPNYQATVKDAFYEFFAFDFVIQDDERLVDIWAKEDPSLQTFAKTTHYARYQVVSFEAGILELVDIFDQFTVRTDHQGLINHAYDLTGAFGIRLAYANDDDGLWHQSSPVLFHDASDYPAFIGKQDRPTDGSAPVDPLFMALDLHNLVGIHGCYRYVVGDIESTGF